MAQQIVIEVPGTKISELERVSNVSRTDVTPVVQKDETKQAEIGQISDFVKSELGSAALKSETDFATPAAVIAANVASQQRDDAINERVDSVEYSISSIKNGADASFNTYTEMLEYVPAQANVSVRVNNDPDITKNGTYTWDGVNYTKGTNDDLEKAKVFTEDFVGLRALFGQSKLKVLNIVDLFNYPFLSIYRDGKVFIKNLPQDIATSILSALSQISVLQQYIFVGLNSKNIIEIRDSNNAVIFKLSRSGDLYIPKFGNLTDFFNNLLSYNTYLDSLISIDTSSNKLISIKDKNGYVLLSLYEDGRLVLPKIGDLAACLMRLKEQLNHTRALPVTASASTGAKYVSQLIADMSTDMSSTVLKVLDVSNVLASGIFAHQIAMIRVPAITRIAKNKYLCCFEAREDGGDLTKNSVGSFVLDVDPDNKTVAYSNLRVIHEAYIDENNLTWSFMNACTARLKSGRIICLYVKRNGKYSHYIYKRYSDDDGLTWSEYEDIGHFFDMPSFNLLCPCSQGLVKKYGENQGRIIFPVWKSGARYLLQEFRSGYIYSDDDGLTWKAGTFFDVVEGNEVSCAEDVNGDILFAIRGELLKPYKTFARLLDNSDKYEYLNVKEKLTEIPIMCGLIHTANEFDNSPGYFLLSQTFTNGRKDLKIWSSYDSGKNWSSYDVPETSLFSSYSCVESVSTDLKLVLWEADNYTSFKCQLVTTKDLLNK
ncbi:sialidase family protein [Acinetobacter baumannii]|nr:sialidase family protein [Acinetobacter baumannii]